jgi:high-affinity iron transporter
MQRFVLPTWLAISLFSGVVRAAEISGRVVMPEVCAPEVSPAVASLEPVNGQKVALPAATGPAEVTLVDQRGLQFVPRVQAMFLGQTVRFGNSDQETHSVHVVSPGFDFNQSMPAGQSRDWIPQKTGVVRLACDVHSHMRGYVVVSDSPWVRVCNREGRFRFKEVPDGRYVLNVWHEMGPPLRRDLVVEGGADRSFGTLTLAAWSGRPVAGQASPPVAWPEVIDRIGITLAASLDSAPRPGQFKKARRLAEDAYFTEFEASDMETAVRTHLGIARKAELERQFFGVRANVKEVAEGRQRSGVLAESNRALLLALVRAAEELNRKGVTDRAHIFNTNAPLAPTPAAQGDRHAQLLALGHGLDRVRELADRGERDDAASEMSSVYVRDFDPLEQFILAVKPQEGGRLERKFLAIRGEVGAGLKGQALTTRLDDLRTEVESALGRSETQASGTFAPAFGASLVLILREGTEVILLLTMLITLVAKAGQKAALRAIYWGVGLAVIASAGTAWALNRLVDSAQGPAREKLEGLIMLAAAGVLFYVSYWLISQSESRRWMDFLKRRVKRGVELGGFGTLALTAFLAVYREGAETSLMYHAMIRTQGQTQQGVLGIAAGLGIGLIGLAAIALVIRATSVRLPLRAFFQVSGVVLFGLAVVFAGNGVFELQAAEILKVTPLSGFSWLGDGIPILGLYPTLQTLSVQAVLLAGALLALVLVLPGDRSPSSTA